VGRSLFLPALVVALAAGVAAAQELPDPRERYAVPAGGAPSLGPDDALVTIVEFSDFYCPYCRRANRVIADLMRVYPDQIRLVYRHGLLDAEDGTLAAEAAIAAEVQGRFWAFHDRMFAAPAPADVDGLVAVGGEVGLDVVELRRALVDRRHRNRARVADKLARGLGVAGIPHFFINGRPVTGAQSLGVFARLVDEELAIAAKLIAGGVPAKEIYGRLVRGAASGAGLMDTRALYASGVDPGEIKAPELAPRSHRRGAARPLVHIVEFSDFDCGYCARAFRTVNAVIESYGDDVGLSYRHFPLGSTTKLVAEAAEAAAAQGKFWELHDRLFATRKTSRADLLDHARAVGLDVAAFEQALDERRYARAVAADAAEGGALGVTGTPTFFINGRPVVGAPSPTALRELIAEELKAARALLARGIPRGEVHARLLERASLPEANTASDERVEIDPVDYHIAVLLACREGDAESAARFYREVKDAPRRRMLRADCKRLGIALPK
jgi:protein-disulfide isomerase